MQLLTLFDFSRSMLILLTNSLETISLLGILIILQGRAVRVFAAVALLQLEFKFSDLGLAGLPHFLLTCVVSIDFVLCT